MPADIAAAHIQVAPGADVSVTVGTDPLDAQTVTLNFAGQADFFVNRGGLGCAPDQSPSATIPPATSPGH